MFFPDDSPSFKFFYLTQAFKQNNEAYNVRNFQAMAVKF